ncbi:hypothetical protein LTR46_002401 [Exophiala xenobiotica]|nr:hypothetical protein LTR46_002401 [Exophiala xenobiotica]
MVEPIRRQSGRVTGEERSLPQRPSISNALHGSGLNNHVLAVGPVPVSLSLDHLAPVLILILDHAQLAMI